MSGRYTVQTGTGKVDPARKFKCTTAAREHLPNKCEDTMVEFPPSKGMLL